MALAADFRSQSSIILLTGFGPFPGMPENVSAKLVGAVRDRARLALRPYRFHACILPTEWNAAPQRVAGLISRLRPSVALHFGVAKDAQGFRIETRGLNHCRMAEDATGRMPSARHLIVDAPDAYDSRLPIERIVARLADLHLPVSTSNDAGGYLCNSVLYHSLHATHAAALCAGFIHIPSTFSLPGFSFDDAISGSLEIVRITLEETSASLVNGR